MRETVDAGLDVLVSAMFNPMMKKLKGGLRLFFMGLRWGGGGREESGFWKNS